MNGFKGAKESEELLKREREMLEQLLDAKLNLDGTFTCNQSGKKLVGPE